MIEERQKKEEAHKEEEEEERRNQQRLFAERKVSQGYRYFSNSSLVGLVWYTVYDDMNGWIHLNTGEGTERREGEMVELCSIAIQRFWR